MRSPGERGEKALDILYREAIDDMSQMGAATRDDLSPALFVSTARVAHPGGTLAGW